MEKAHMLPPHAPIDDGHLPVDTLPPVHPPPSYAGVENQNPARVSSSIGTLTSSSLTSSTSLVRPVSVAPTPTPLAAPGSASNSTITLDPTTSSAAFTRTTTTSTPSTLPALSASTSTIPTTTSNSDYTALPPIKPDAQNEGQLPSLSFVTGPNLYRDATTNPNHTTNMPFLDAQLPASHWPSMNPLTQYYKPSHLQTSASSPASSSSAKMDIDLPGPRRDSLPRGSSVSLDDPDVRMAAEALGHLRADFGKSPPRKAAPLPSSSSSGNVTPQRPEPLLNLLVTSHPLIGSTIEGATAAYASGKTLSPRFKSGAEYVEGFVTPVANTVGTVSRATGFEGTLRWYFKKARGRRSKASPYSPQDAKNEDNHKRRKLANSTSKDVATATLAPAVPATTTLAESERRLSIGTIGTIETLPAYDDVRSPEYAEVEGSTLASKKGLLVSTSGLSIAMSEESLRKLKYCLAWLKWANDHMKGSIQNLKTALDQYDANVVTPEMQEEGLIAAERSKIVERIAVIKNDLLKTLQDMISTIQKYSGGALPDNAKRLIQGHLTSLPARFRRAQMGQLQEAEKDTTIDARLKGEQQPQHAGVAEKAVHDGAQRVLVLAKEGLDMMEQVRSVLDVTITSAEEWCERLGKKRRAGSDCEADTERRVGTINEQAKVDVEMGGTGAGMTTQESLDVEMCG